MEESLLQKRGPAEIRKAFEELTTSLRKAESSLVLPQPITAVQIYNSEQKVNNHWTPSSPNLIVAYSCVLILAIALTLPDLALSFLSLAQTLSFLSLAQALSFLSLAQALSFLSLAQALSFLSLAQALSFLSLAQTLSFLSLAQSLSFLSLAQTLSFLSLAQTLSFLSLALALSFLPHSSVSFQFINVKESKVPIKGSALHIKCFVQYSAVYVLFS